MVHKPWDFPIQHVSKKHCMLPISCDSLLENIGCRSYCLKRAAGRQGRQACTR